MLDVRLFWLGRDRRRKVWCKSSCVPGAAGVALPVTAPSHEYQDQHRQIKQPRDPRADGAVRQSLSMRIFWTRARTH